MPGAMPAWESFFSPPLCCRPENREEIQTKITPVPLPEKCPPPAPSRYLPCSEGKVTRWQFGVGRGAQRASLPPTHLWTKEIWEHCLLFYDLLYWRCWGVVNLHVLSSLRYRKNCHNSAAQTEKPSSSVSNPLLSCPPSFFLSESDFFSADCDDCFVLTKADSSHQATALVVMLKESDLMSHTVIGAEAFGCFCQRAERSDWAGLCSGRTGSRPRELGVKGEVSSWKYRARDREGRGLPHGILGPGKSM